MREVLRYDEMKARFPDEWVLVGDPETDESLQVLGGVVLWHSKDRDQVYGKAIELKPPIFATLCFAEIPDDVVVVL